MYRDSGALKLKVDNVVFTTTDPPVSVYKQVRYIIDLSAASLAAADVPVVKDNTNAVISVATGIPGTTGAQLSFFIATASAATGITVTVLSDVFNMTVLAGEAQVDSMQFNDKSGIVIAG